MGLIKSAVGAVSSTLQDQWKEAIRCDEMTGDMLMVKKTTPTGVISKGSTIIVAPGQCAIIYDNGKVIDATAEDGIYTFDSSSTPSFFGGQFKDSFKEMWARFTYDGATSKQQAVFFFNLKEIMDNKFGTATPIPFQDWSHPIPNRMTNTMTPLSVKVRCYGTYTFKIDNPAIFMQELAGTAEVYYKSSVVGQIRSEVLASFQNVLNELGNSEHKVPVLEMPSQTDEMKQMMEERIFDEPVRRRGIRLISFAVESVTLEEESERKINEYELGSNSYMQQGRMTTAFSNAVETAAGNTSGATNGFMGIGMMNMATGGMMGGNATAPWQNQNEQGNSQNYNPYENKQQSNQTNAQQTFEQKINNAQNAQGQMAEQNLEQPITNSTQNAQGQMAEQNLEQPIANSTQNVQKQMAEQNLEQPIANSTQNVQEQMTEQNLEQPRPVPEHVLENNNQNEQEQIHNEKINSQNNLMENSQGDTVNSTSRSVKMCPKCGNMNPANARFCINCGNQL